tara:strand:+ start:1454 stop:1732 length:279 start_codon:yes stop_codon:yes gene_type:complete
MSYKIKNRQLMNAKKLGVQIKASNLKTKKLDVFKKGKKIASIGAKGYTDYSTMLLKDKAQADNKKKAYKSRHQKNRSVAGKPGYYADKILWN